MRLKNKVRKNLSKFTLSQQESTSSSDNTPDDFVLADYDRVITKNTSFWSDSKNTLWIVSFLIVILVSVVLGYFMYSVGLPSSKPPVKQVPLVTEPTITPKPSPNLKDYKIQVLNGSGVPGAAAKAKEILEAQGLTVTNIDNANENIEKTTITYSKQVIPAALDKIKSALSSSDALLTKFEDDEEGDYDIIVTLGTTR